MKKILSKLKAVKQKVLYLIIEHKQRLITSFIGLVFLLGAVTLYELNSYTTPLSVKDFSNTSVIIVDKNGNSGGSGVVLNSYISYSEILTNKHVCSLASSGGYVYKDEKKYLVDSIKKYPVHDLCLVKVYANFGVNTKLLRGSLEKHTVAYISGHPSLLPHVLTTGHFSSKIIINLVVGIKECTIEDEENFDLECLTFGEKRIIQSFESQLVTGTILPGSSGSAVFNSKGEISGLVFAGRGRGLGYAFIVPQSYVLDFVDNKEKYKYIKTNRTKYYDLFKSIFSMYDKCNNKLCQGIENYMVWRNGK